MLSNESLKTLNYNLFNTMKSKALIREEKAILELEKRFEILLEQGELITSNLFLCSDMYNKEQIQFIKDAFNCDDSLVFKASRIIRAYYYSDNKAYNKKIRAKAIKLVNLHKKYRYA